MSEPLPEFDFEAVYGALPIAVALLADGRVARTNRAMAELFHSTPEQLSGRSPWDFVADPDLRPQLRARYEARLRGDPATPQYEMELVRDDASRFRVQCQARALDSRHTVIVFRELVVGAPLASALSEAAAAVQRAHTPERVIDTTLRSLVALGLVPYLARVRDGAFHIVRPPVPDAAIEAFERLTGRAVTEVLTPELDELAGLEVEPVRAHHIDDFPAVVRGYLERAGVPFEAISQVLLAPAYARAIVAPLMIEEQVWGTLTVTASWLQSADTGAIALFAGQVASALEVAISLQSLQQTNRQLAAVHAVAAAGSESELHKLVPKLLDIAIENIAGDCAALWLAEGGELVLAGAVHWDGAQPGQTRMPVSSSRTGAILERGPSCALDLEHERACGRPVQCKEGLRHMAVFPLRHLGRSVGALNIGRMRDQAFSAHDLKGGELIADQVAIQIENARLIESERHRAQHLQLLHDVSQVINASLDPDEILEAAASSIARMIDASDGFIWLYDPLARELRGAATSTPELREHFCGLRLQIDSTSTAAAQAMVSRGPVRITDTGDPDASSLELSRLYNLRSLVSLPLLLRDQPIGAVSIGDRYRPRAWTDAEVGRATVVASQVAVAVANARLFDDLKRSYDKLAQTREELVKRERLAALGELSAVVAHEVRNPLGVIFNSLGSLRKAVRGQRDAEMLLGIVGEESDRLNRIVSDLLDFARPHEASLRLEPLEPVLHSAREATLALTGGAVAIAIAAPERLPQIVQDGRMLRQALINLLVNAVQASPRGAQVVLRAQVVPEAVQLEVIDSGKGIPAAHRPRIFQPFFTTKATGTGLGLAVVRRIVEAHRGEVALSSEEGRGTTFSLRLPIPPSEARPAPGASAQELP